MQKILLIDLSKTFGKLHNHKFLPLIYSYNKVFMKRYKNLLLFGRTDTYKPLIVDWYKFGNFTKEDVIIEIYFESDKA